MKTVLYYGTTTQIHSGAAQWMYRLADRMREQGFYTVAVLPGNDGIANRYSEADIDVEYLEYEPIRRRTFLSQVKYAVQMVVATVQLIRLIDEHEIDILHVNETIYLPPLLAGWITRTRTVCHVRVCFESYLLRWIFGKLVGLLADDVVCVSHRTRQLMFESVGALHERVHVVYDSVPEPYRFDANNDGSEFRDCYDIPQESSVVMSLSKLVEEKGQRRVIDAAKNISREDAVVVLVGGTVDGHESYAENIRTAAEDERNIRVTGFHPDIVEALFAADIFVHIPTNEDPFPGVVLEAMLAGIPVIGSYSGGIPEQIIDNETGYLVGKHGSASSVAERITRLLRDPDLREQLGNAGRELVLRRLAYESHFEEMAALYNKDARFQHRFTN